MSGDCENSKELEFRYESDASSSFLVIGCRPKIIEFQARMLENNSIQYIVPVEVVKVEGACHLYYNITSKISLSMYLKRYKLKREEFLKLLLNLSSCISNSSGYLLYASNFMFDPEYLYIEPETMDVRLVYIPAYTCGNTCGTLQTLASDLLMCHIHEADFCSGNLVQRILSEVGSETFNIKSFKILLNELLYGYEADIKTVQQKEKDFCDIGLEKSSKKDKIEEIQEDKEKKVQKKSFSLLIPMVLLQFVMGAIIFMCRGFLDNVGENRTTTYAAVLMVVAAVDVLLFKKLRMLKLFSKKNADAIEEAVPKDNPEYISSKAQETDKNKSDKPDISNWSDRPDWTEEPVAIMAQNPSKIKSECVEHFVEKAYREIAVSTEMDMKQKAKADSCEISTGERAEYKEDNAAARYMQKTEILGSRNKGPHVLKCKGRLAGDSDIVINKDEFIIGRLQGHVDHILLNNAVGKLHAELICRNGTCFLKDLNSINGTFINDMRIESNKEVELRNNDSVQFANSEFVFVRGVV